MSLQKEHHTKKITQNFHFEKFPFQSICLQTLIVHGDKVTKHRSSSRFPQNSQKQRQFSDGQ